MSGEPGGSAVKSHVEGRDSPGKVRRTCRPRCGTPSCAIRAPPQWPAWARAGIPEKFRHWSQHSLQPRSEPPASSDARPWFGTCLLQVTPPSWKSQPSQAGSATARQQHGPGPTDMRGGRPLRPGDAQVSVSPLVLAGLVLAGRRRTGLSSRGQRAHPAGLRPGCLLQVTLLSLRAEWEFKGSFSTGSWRKRTLCVGPPI